MRYINKVNKIFETSPIVVAGMHRSGTTYLSKKLSSKVEMGKKVSPTHESKLFQDINIDILNKFGGGWLSFQGLPGVDELSNDYESYADMMKRPIESLIIKQHLGYKYILNNSEWGWKEPRTSLLLPLYYKIFPQMRILHVSRGPREVARSIVTRFSKRRAIKDTEQEIIEYKLALNAWEQYEKRILESYRLFSGEKIQHIKYEDLEGQKKVILFGLEFELNDFKLSDPSELPFEKKIELSNFASKYYK